MVGGGGGGRRGIHGRGSGGGEGEGFMVGAFPVAPVGRIAPCLSGFPSNASTLLVRDSPGQPGAALRRRRAPGQGAAAPAVDRRRRRGRFLSRRIWAGHSLRGSIIILVRVLPLPTTENSSKVMRPEPRRRKRILGQFTRISVCIRTSRLCYSRALLAGVFSLAHRDSVRSLFTQSAKHPSRRRFLSASSRRPPQAVLSSVTISSSSSSWTPRTTRSFSWLPFPAAPRGGRSPPAGA
jgi:hypothetical protein